MDYTKEGRDEVLRHAIANMYFYLEMSDEWNGRDSEELLFKYPLEMYENRYHQICLAHEDNPAGKDETLKQGLSWELGIKSFEVLNYEVKSLMRGDTVLILFTVRMQKEDYLNLLYNRLYDVIPFVDVYSHRPEVELEGVAQQYGLGAFDLLKPIDSSSDEVDLFPLRKGY